MVIYDTLLALENWQASCPFNLAHKLKRTKNVLNENEARETEMEVLLCKTKKNHPETAGCERDRSLRSKET